MGSGSIEVVDVHKTFRLPHQQRTTIKSHLLHPFDRIQYEEHHALGGVTFNVEPGEFFGIIGANGSGKSTLLKVVAGIYHPNRGYVRVTGLLSPFIELGVGFNPELSARDNVRINGTLLGLSRKELDRRFDGIFEFAELENFVDQKLKNYSSGMQLRLAFSIAIQVDFQILLLDEVLAVGDQNFQQKCFATFERFKAAGKTVVLVSHSLAEVRRFCDQAVLLEHGRVRAAGRTAAVVDTYESVRSDRGKETVPPAVPQAT